MDALLGRLNLLDRVGRDFPALRDLARKKSDEVINSLRCLGPALMRDDVAPSLFASTAPATTAVVGRDAPLIIGDTGATARATGGATGPVATGPVATGAVATGRPRLEIAARNELVVVVPHAVEDEPTQPRPAIVERTRKRRRSLESVDEIYDMVTSPRPWKLARLDYSPPFPYWDLSNAQMPTSPLPSPDYVPASPFRGTPSVTGSDDPRTAEHTEGLNGYPPETPRAYRPASPTYAPISPGYLPDIGYPWTSQEFVLTPRYSHDSPDSPGLVTLLI